jgi:hypothetical protein
LFKLNNKIPILIAANSAIARSTYENGYGGMGFGGMGYWGAGPLIQEPVDTGNAHIGIFSVL